MKKVFLQLCFVVLGSCCSEVFSISMSSPVCISDPLLSSTTPRVSMNALNNATVVWESLDVNGMVLRGNRRLDGYWQQPTAISVSQQTWILEPQVAMNDAGDAVVVWGQKDLSSLQYTVYASILDRAAITWSEPICISTNGQNAINPKVVINGSGNAIAVWTENSSVVTSSQYSRTQGTWSTPVALSDTSMVASGLQIVLNGQDKALLAWSSIDASSSSIWARAFINGEWQPSQTISSAGTNAKYCSVGMDAIGNGMVVYQTPSTVKAVLYSQGIWSTPQTVINKSVLPQIAMNATGNAVLAWIGYEEETGSVIKAQTYIGGTWSLPAYIASTTISPSKLQIAIDGEDNAAALWFDKTAGPILQSSTLTDGAWSAPQAWIDTWQPCQGQALVVSDTGDLLAVGVQKIEDQMLIVAGTGSLETI